MRLWFYRRFDAALCAMFPGLARWGVADIDPVTGKVSPLGFVRFRWRRSAMLWIFQVNESTEGIVGLPNLHTRPLTEQERKRTRYPL